MPRCNRQTYTNDTAKLAVQRRQNSAAWLCGECDKLHVTTKEVARGEILTLSNSGGNVITYFPGEITNIE